MKLLRYAIVGLMTMLVYLGSGAMMQSYGAPISLLASISFSVAIAINYIMQKAWVFKNIDYDKGSLQKYMFMTCFGYFINIISLIVMTPYTSLFLAQMSAFVLVVASNALFSFLWIFSPQKNNYLLRVLVITAE